MYASKRGKRRNGRGRRRNGGGNGGIIILNKGGWIIIKWGVRQRWAVPCVAANPTGCYSIHGQDRLLSTYTDNFSPGKEKDAELRFRRKVVTSSTGSQGNDWTVESIKPSSPCIMQLVPCLVPEYLHHQTLAPDYQITSTTSVLPIHDQICWMFGTIWLFVSLHTVSLQVLLVLFMDTLHSASVSTRITAPWAQSIGPPTEADVA